MLSRRHFLATASAALAAPLASRAHASTRQLRMTLDIQLQGMHAPFYVARDKGYLAEEGIALIIDQGEGSAAVTPRVMSGTYDIGFGDINAIAEQAAGRPGRAPVMVYQYYNKPPFSLITKASSGINTLKDFEGKTYGAPAGAATARLVTALTKLNGVDGTKLKFSAMQSKIQEQMFLNGSVDALASYDNNVYFNLKMLGQNPDRDFKFFNYGNYGLDLYANGLMVSQSLRNESPDIVRGLVRAVNRATRDVAADPASGMASLVKVEPLLRADIERQRLDYCFRNSFMSAETERLGFGTVDMDRLNRGLKLVAEAYGLGRVPAADEVFDSSFLPPAADRAFRYNFGW